MAKWEYFCDAAYYGMWAVREVNEKRWGHCFHVSSMEEAKGLCELLEGGDKNKQKLKDDILKECVFINKLYGTLTCALMPSYNPVLVAQLEKSVSVRDALGKARGLAYMITEYFNDDEEVTEEDYED